MRRAFALVGFSVVVGVAGGACESESDTELEATETPRDEVAYGIAEVLCGGATECCAANGLDQPGRSCVTVLRNDVFVEFLRADEQKREVLIAHGEACIDAYRAAVVEAPSCEELPHPVHIRHVCPQLFGDVAEGTRPPGDICSALHQCASPAEGEGERSCRSTQLYQPATCTWLVPVADGGACGELGGGRYGVCDEGQGCAVREAGAEPACGAKVAVGESCVDNDSCPESYVCGGGDQALFCQAPLGIGGDCRFAPASCDLGLICDDLSGTCIDVPILRDCGGSFVCPHPLDPYCAD